MKTSFKLWSLAFSLCLLPNLTTAQEFLTGFYRPGETPASGNRQIQVQTLPFYDDFSESNRYPDSCKWIDRNAFVNSGFPLHPVTRNAATLDVLDAQGQVYNFAISNPFIAEYLTSTTIRLDSVFDPEPRALTPADSVYLSFYYQPQGNGLAPETNDSLVLEFGIPNEFDTTWHHIWSAPGQTLAQFLQENDSNYFKQVMIPITDLNYFKSSFFFRFYNYASIANSTQPTSRGNEDHWNIDMAWTFYNHGPGGDGWADIYTPTMYLDEAARHFTTMKVTGVFEASEQAGPLGRLALAQGSAIHVHYMIYGMLAVLAVSALRFRFSRFPFHPVLFLVAGTYPCLNAWFSFLLGWAVKQLVVRFGGGGVYKKFKPFFIGLIAGEILIVGTSLLVDFMHYWIFDTVAPVRVRFLPG